MARVSRFKVAVPLYAVGAPDGLTVSIERTIGDAVFSVRIKRQHREYQLPLSTVAGMVVHRIALAEAAEKRRLKKAKRRRSS